MRGSRKIASLPGLPSDTVVLQSLTRDPVQLALAQAAGFGWNVWPGAGAVQIYMGRHEYPRWLSVQILVDEGLLVMPTSPPGLALPVADPRPINEVAVRWAASWEEVVSASEALGCRRDAFSTETRRIIALRRQRLKKAVRDG